MLAALLTPPSASLLGLSAGCSPATEPSRQAAQRDEVCEQFHAFPFVQSCQAFPCEVSRTDGSFLLFPFLFVPLG